MFSFFFLFVFLFVPFGFCQAQGRQLQNITVDDGYSAITYAGSWEKSSFTTLNYGGYHMLTRDPTAQAIFDFTGNAVYFMSPLWPYDVAVQVQVDSRPPELIDLRDYSTQATDGGPETVGSHVVWGISALGNGNHRLSITLPNGHQWGVLDSLVYTSVVDVHSDKSVPPTPSLPFAPSSTSSSTAERPHSKGTNVLAIVLGIGLSSLFLICSAFLFYYLRYRRSRPRRKLDLEIPSFTCKVASQEQSRSPRISSSNLHGHYDIAQIPGLLKPSSVDSLHSHSNSALYHPTPAMTRVPSLQTSVLRELPPSYDVVFSSVPGPALEVYSGRTSTLDGNSVSKTFPPGLSHASVS